MSSILHVYVMGVTSLISKFNEELVVPLYTIQFL
jgi:hypothetical protein